MISFRAAKAPTGNPPPITLPYVATSARTPRRSCAPPGAKRNPVMTSSKISNAPWVSHKLRKPSKKPVCGKMHPIFPATGSTIIAAISSGFAVNISATCSKLLYCAKSVSCAVPAVTPGLFGLPKVTAPLPAWIKKASA